MTCWCQMQDSSGLPPFTSALPIFVSQNLAFFFPKTSFTNCSNISPKPPTKCQKVTLVPSLSSFEDFHPEGPALHSGKGATQNLGGSGWVPTLSIMTCSYLSIFFLEPTHKCNRFSFVFGASFVKTSMTCKMLIQCFVMFFS